MINVRRGQEVSNFGQGWRAWYEPQARAAFAQDWKSLRTSHRHYFSTLLIFIVAKIEIRFTPITNHKQFFLPSLLYVVTHRTIIHVDIYETIKYDVTDNLCDVKTTVQILRFLYWWHNELFTPSILDQWLQTWSQ